MPDSAPKLNAGILIVSETASQDPTTDRSGSVLKDVFAAAGDIWSASEVKIVPDDIRDIQAAIQSWTDKHDDALNLVVTSGGTGFAEKDVTPEVGHSSSEVVLYSDMLQAVTPLIHKHATGLV